MARTIADIKKSITDVLIQDPEIINAYQLTPDKTFEEEFSAASVESIILYAASYGIYVHETLFDEHKAEVRAIIDNMKPGSQLWYANKAKDYQKGFALAYGSDKYDNTGFTDEVINASKIIKHAVAVEQDRGMRIKVATEINGLLDKVSDIDMPGLKAYMEKVKYAGVPLNITSGVADSLRLNLLVKYDPLVLDAEGKRLDGNGPQTVQDAVKNYLKNLPFNGRLELSALMDALQLVDGVKAPYVTLAQKRYGIMEFTSFENMVYEPDAGYMKIYDEVNDLQITFEGDV